MYMCLSMSWESLILYGADLAKRISLNLGLCTWAWPWVNGSIALNTQPLPSAAHFAGTRPAVLAGAAGGRSAGLLSAPSSCFSEHVFAAPPHVLHTLHHSALLLPIWWVIFSKALWQLGDRRALRKICFEDLHVSWTFILIIIIKNKTKQNYLSRILCGICYLKNFPCGLFGRTGSGALVYLSSKL